MAQAPCGCYIGCMPMPYDPQSTDPKRRRFRTIPLRMLVPNVITLLAICAGLTAIRLSTEGRLELALAAIAIPMAYTHASHLSSAGKRGIAYGLTLSAFQLANVVAPAVAGFLAAAGGTQPLFGLSALFLAIAALWMHRRL